METAFAFRPGPPAAPAPRPSMPARRPARVAIGGIAAFMLLYGALAGWFLYTGCRLTIGAEAGAPGTLVGWLAGLYALLLAAFMLMPLFATPRRAATDGVEVTAEQQPGLFRLLQRLADMAGVRTPYRVFLAPTLGASVICDAAPTHGAGAACRLEIGLGLVNSLTLGEFRAVLAHELGHIAQPRAAPDRWAPAVRHLVNGLSDGRDQIDRLIRWLARLDPLLGWLGWPLRLLVWAIRALVSAGGHGVEVLRAGWSRAKEFDADRTAVSLAGSEAVVHALYRLELAEAAWAQALDVAFTQRAAGEYVRDVFELQSRLAAHTARARGGEGGRAPGLAALNEAAMRLFATQLSVPVAHVSTHPSNLERVAHAHWLRVALPPDARSAWAVFVDAKSLRERVTACLLGTTPPPRDEGADPVLGPIDASFEGEHCDPRYRGMYYGRSIVLGTTDPRTLRDALPALDPAMFNALYPESLADDVAEASRLRAAWSELDAVRRRVAQPPRGGIVYRGLRVRRQHLQVTLQGVAREIDTVQARLAAHDRQCRSTHRAAAATLGNAWAIYLDGLLGTLHYAEHTQYRLRRLRAALDRSADAPCVPGFRRRRTERIVADAAALHEGLTAVFREAASVELDRALRTRLDVNDWAYALGPFMLAPVKRDALDEWRCAARRWGASAENACAGLARAALDELLRTERALAGHVRDGTRPEPAPIPSCMPPRYATLQPDDPPDALPGTSERLRAWAALPVASTDVRRAARLVVAAVMLGGVILLAHHAGVARVIAYNGLARPVRVTVGDAPPQAIAAFGSAVFKVGTARRIGVEARTDDGRLIERFEESLRGSFAQRIYNVASAAPLVESPGDDATAYAPRPLGTTRWLSSGAVQLFGQARPAQAWKLTTLSHKALAALGRESPAARLALAANPAEREHMVLMHAAFDAVGSAHLATWLRLAQDTREGRALLATRLAESPDDPGLRVLEQDLAVGDERRAVCERHRERALAAPANADRRYVHLRCLPDGADTAAAWAQARLNHPRHGWFAHVAARGDAAHQRWADALRGFETARSAVAELAEPAGLEMARIQRLQLQDRSRAYTRSVSESESLRHLVGLETGDPATLAEAPHLRAYTELEHGRIAAASAVAQPSPQGRARLLRLAAASDGADPLHVAQALAMPLSLGIDDDTVWSAVGLAVRARHSLAHYRAAAGVTRSAEFDALWRFAEALQTAAHADVAERAALAERAEQALGAVPTDLRGQAWSLGTVALGSQAPQAWRDGAKRLLFASERPHFD